MPIRPIVQSMVRRKVKENLTLQGFGRHTRAEQDALAIADIDALATLLNEKAFLMGEKPCGADATVFSFLACFLSPTFATKVRAAAEKHQNLVGYRDRILSRYFKI
jgi:glutathione S-transferase